MNKQMVLPGPTLVLNKTFLLLNKNRNVIAILLLTHLLVASIQSLLPQIATYLLFTTIFFQLWSQAFFINAIKQTKNKKSKKVLAKRSFLQAPGLFFLMALIGFLTMIPLFISIFSTGIITGILAVIPVKTSILNILTALILIPLGIFFTVKWALGFVVSDYIYLFTQRGVRDSLRQSSRLVKGHRLWILVHTFVMFLPSVILSIVSTAVMSYTFFTTFDFENFVPYNPSNIQPEYFWLSLVVLLVNTLLSFFLHSCIWLHTLQSLSQENSIE